MTDPGLAVHRLVLRLYPKDFRREYGPEMTQLFTDRRRHDGASTARILAREVTDAAVTATTMRTERPMSRIVWIAVAMSLTIALALVVGAPLLVGVVGIVLVSGLVAVRRHRFDRPLDRPRRWRAWILAGAVAISPAVAILVTSDDEISEVLWSVMALSLSTGTVLLLIGLVLALGRHRPAATAA